MTKVAQSATKVLQLVYHKVTVQQMVRDSESRHAGAEFPSSFPKGSMRLDGFASRSNGCFKVSRTDLRKRNSTVGLLGSTDGECYVERRQGHLLAVRALRAPRCSSELSM